MAMLTLSLNAKAVGVAISKSGSKIAVLSSNEIAVYALNLGSRPISKPTLLWRSEFMQGHCPRHVAFSGDEQVYVLTDQWDEGESFLWRSENDTLIPHGPIMEAYRVSSLFPSVDNHDLHIHLESGAVHQIATSIDAMDLPPQTNLLHQFSSLIPEVKVVTYDGKVCFFLDFLMMPG